MPRHIFLLVAFACGWAGEDHTPVHIQVTSVENREKAAETAGTVVLTLPGPHRTRSVDPRPAVPAPAYPPGFERESALFLQTQIGRSTDADARNLFGEPSRRRAAADDNGSDGKGGHILAFPDPTGRYKELELDFNPGTGVLRAVFAYPSNLPWRDCRKVWGDDFTATRANKGRTFYSYTTRRLDVLVDSGGSVISLGLY